MTKRIVKIKESQLNEIINKVIKEQESAQVMTTGPSAEQTVGTPEGENDSEPMTNEGPDFTEFVGCAKELMNQGVTIGNLIDQVLEAEEAEPENGEMMPNPDTEGGVDPNAPMN